MRRWLLVQLLLWPMLANAQYAITGDDAVCPAQIKTYTVTGTPAPITFQWSVTGGNIMNINNGTATVVWGGAGSGTVSVILLNAGGVQIGNPSLPVTITAIPDPVLTTNFDNECILYEDETHGMPVPIINNDDCWHVCELSTVNYYVSSSNPNSTFIWNVTGAIGFTQLTSTEIEVYWGGPGQGAVSVTEITPEGCEATTSKCIIIIESPRAIITVTPQNADCREGGTLTICLNQLLNFNGNALLGNSNSPITEWLWDFGDGTFSTAQNTTHQWTTPGTYYVTLTVTNACNCSGTCMLEVVVDPVEGVNIEWVTPVCARDTGHYRTDAVCNTYLWTAVNGTIIGGQGTGQVTVVWNDGSNGNGILCLDNTNGQCPNYCPSVTCVDIPIIADQSSISGPAIVCVGSQVKYSVPSMTGSIYHWSLAGGNGIILFGQGTNEILVEWNQTGNDVVTVDYENQLLDCGGRAELHVEISTGFSISGPLKACQGDDIVFTADNPQNILLDWTATDNQGNQTNLGSGTGDPDFTVANWWLGSGIFVITASDPAQPQSYCNVSASFTIEISEQPPPPPLPAGDNLICPGKPYLYTCSPTNASYYLQWTITEGNPPAATGTQVTIHWNHAPQNPYMISIVQIETGTGCISDPVNFPVFLKQYVEPVITENALQGPFLHCINSTHTFEISNAGNGPADYKYDHLEWIITSEVRGSVTANQGTTSVDVQWNNTVSPLPLPPSGNHDVYLQVKTYLCGIEYYKPNHYQNEPHNVYLTGSLPVSITPDNATVCEWEPVNFSFNPPINNGVYLWDFGNGQSSNAQNPVFSYDLPPGAVVTTYPVNLTVTDLQGCIYYASTYITVNPEPLLGIGATSMAVCNSTSILTAISQPNVSYQWSTGETTQQITISVSGTYTVTVTNPTTGCANDEQINIAGCGSGNPVSCTVDPALTIHHSYGSNCNIVDFSATYSGNNGTPVSWDWQFGNGQSSAVQNPGLVTYQFAGIYTVTLLMTTSTGHHCAAATVTVTIKAVPDFKVVFSCPNSSSGGYYVASFIDYTTYAFPLTAYTWSWSDAQSSWTDNVQEPVAYFSPGSHPITLFISDGQNPVCRITKTILIPQPPDPAFTVSAGPYCEEQTVVHFSASNTSVIHALWDFGDQSSYVPPNPSNTIDAYRVFAQDGQPIITLTLTDFYGCTYSSMQTVTVNDNDLGGEITSPVVFCPGAGGVLEFQSGTPTQPTGWLWSTGATTQTITVYQTGLYWVTVSHAPSGCTFTPAQAGNAAAINVPQPVIRGDMLLCEGELLQLDGNQGPLPLYDWSITPSIAVSSHDPWTLVSDNPMQPGTYHVVLTLTQNGCTLTTSADVVVNPLPPPPDIQSNVQHPCEGQPIQLTVTNAGNNWVNWSNGLTGPMITVYNANLYQATMTDANGCTSTGTFEVHPNPYTGFMTTGCLTYCDTIDITIPGSALLSGIGIPYTKWTWYVNGLTQPGWTGANSPVAPLPLGTLSPGVYVITLHLVVQYPGLTECDIWTDPLEITVVKCPCQLEPHGRIYCMEPIVNDKLGPFLYHFEIWPNYQCSGNPLATVTAQNGAVTLLPWNNPPGYITGILSTPGLYPDYACIELTFTDPLHPECNCNYIWCEKLPKCPFGVHDCDFGITYGEIFCIGFDPAGNPIYQLQINITTANPLHATWLSQGITLSGFPTLIPAGQQSYTVTVTAPPTATNFCIHLQAYDFVTHRICMRKICISDLPGCEVPTRAMLPVTPVSSKPVLTVPWLQASLHLIPNPASEEVTVYYMQPSAGTLSVMTPEGKEVNRMALNDNTGQVTLNLSDYPPGIYLVSLKPDSGNALFRKLAVIR